MGVYVDKCNGDYYLDITVCINKDELKKQIAFLDHSLMQVVNQGRKEEIEGIYGILELLMDDIPDYEGKPL